VNILLNALLIPDYGVVGAAFSSMLTQVTMGMIQGVIVIAIFKIKISPVTYIRYSLTLILLIVTTLVIDKIFNAWYTSFLTINILALIFGFLTKVLRVKNFKVFFK
jgi:O-antigen/teichoic acid export membrane protein